MWLLEMLNDLFGPTRAARNAAVVLDSHRAALAAVDSAVDRLQRHAVAPAA
jgi:hypothetical protein